MISCRSSGGAAACGASAAGGARIPASIAAISNSQMATSTSLGETVGAGNEKATATQRIQHTRWNMQFDDKRSNWIITEQVGVPHSVGHVVILHQLSRGSLGTPSSSNNSARKHSVVMFNA